MTEGELLQLYERMNDHEYEHRDKIIARLQFVFAMLTALVSFDFFLISKLAPSVVTSTFLASVFVVLFVLGATLLAASVYYFIRALWNHRYECLPFPRDLESHWRKLCTHYQGKPELASNWMGTAVRDYFIGCASKNAEVNQLRAHYVHLSTSYLIPAFPCALIAGAAFLGSGMNLTT